VSCQPDITPLIYNHRLISRHRRRRSSHPGCRGHEAGDECWCFRRWPTLNRGRCHRYSGAVLHKVAIAAPIPCYICSRLLQKKLYYGNESVFLDTGVCQPISPVVGTQNTSIAITPAAVVFCSSCRLLCSLLYRKLWNPCFPFLSQTIAMSFWLLLVLNDATDISRDLYFAEMRVCFTKVYD
jgi:hypothetical protein